jgi:glyoxylase-like metal-dependent hydrolase (beta-lactamase superfamily II)
MLTRNLGEGVHRVTSADVNFYLVEGEDGVTVVDAGLPAMYPLLARSLVGMGYGRADIKALVLTHAHFDHLGFAARLQRELGIPVWGHAADAYIAAHPYRYRHEKNRLLFVLSHPGGLPVLARMTAAGALNVPAVRELTLFGSRTRLDVPGRPEIIFTPGHTDGHCALFLPDRNVLFSGDALVTLDPYTGRTGPHIVAGAATADSGQALASLDRLAETGAGLVLPGHGEPWTEGVAGAVELARGNGPA